MLQTFQIQLLFFSHKKMLKWKIDNFAILFLSVRNAYVNRNFSYFILPRNASFYMKVKFIVHPMWKQKNAHNEKYVKQNESQQTKLVSSEK